MKWPTKQRPARGATRIRRAFLLFPLSLQGQTRWLERASWIELNVSDCAPFQTVWTPTKWLPPGPPGSTLARFPITNLQSSIINHQ